MQPIAIPFSEFRRNLAKFLDRCAVRGERLTVTRHARSDVVLLSRAEWDEIAETLLVLSDKKLVSQIVDSRDDLKRGRHRPASEVFDALTKKKSTKGATKKGR
ncbi:MAG: type II toxin-antitoxin system Phd/YefM family antitoxin [Phycisphaerae bacterium]|nr:type II toxin-antitoxin system Phd/YefM family antitoxin [Phycisphaerae bacterium]